MHNDFRLIVVAEKNAVYNPKKYPIPLVNRLEKHLLNMDSVLNAKMKEMVEVLNLWCIDITKISEMFAGFKLPAAQFLARNSIASKAHDAVTHLKPSDLFTGFTQDTLPSLVYKLCKEEKYQRLFSAHNELEYDGNRDAEEVCLFFKR